MKSENRPDSDQIVTGREKKKGVVLGNWPGELKRE